MDKSVVNIITSVRNHKRMAQREVAEFLKMPLSSYSSYERGVAVPPLKVMEKLSDLYGLTLDQLSGRSPIDLAGFILPINKSDLKAFTMAAMQGLCMAFGKEIAMEDYATLLAKDAIDVARATLTDFLNSNKPWK